MMNANLSARPAKALATLVTAVAGVVVVTLLMLWLAGFFVAKVSPVVHRRPLPTGETTRTAPVQLLSVPRVEPAVGSVRAVQETSLSSKILARVVDVRATAGKAVRRDEVLLVLDDAELRSRLEQAEASESAARAARDQARIELDRIEKLHAERSAAAIELDRAQSQLKAADAELTRAERAVSEAKVMLSYATIVAPIDGVVIEKQVEVGDLAVPGRGLLAIYDPTRMQLVAGVRETLATRLSVGSTIGVRIDALDLTCEGRISEVVPQADVTTRTFDVKVVGPCPPGVYSGMFGRILIPLDPEPVLVVPPEAVRHVGQLALVTVMENGRARTQAVTLGRTFDQGVQVLSGLREGELVALTGNEASPQ